ncbi:hypothetical protein ACFY2Z_30180 [Streptomyces sp. NPDC001222]|uniref:hypothetical protein n=1 Tax=Streptomyces sp. NPDC001222 TaxID=3364548 RepID=UPI0036BC22F2
MAAEIRRLASVPEARRTVDTRLLCTGADSIARHLDAGDIKELPLPTSDDTFNTSDKIGQVLRQLKEIDAATAERTGRNTDRVGSAHKHAGEAHSIVSALRTIAFGRRTLLLTNDGGAMAVAERNAVPFKHVGHLLAELACHDANVNADQLFDAFTQITRKFATVPMRHQPKDKASFSCLMQGGSCRLCD